MEVARLQVAFDATGQDKVQSALKQTDAGIKDLANNSVAGAGRIGSAFSGAGKAIALGFGVVAAAGIANIAGGFLMANASAEQYHISLETVTGSQEKANALFKDLQAFAASTPFEFPELVQASINLEAFGLNTNEWIGTIGDTASAMGKSVDTVTQAVLDAATGQYERLKELGISAQVEGDKLALNYMKNGKQVTEYVDKNNKELITSTIKAIWNDKYAGAMEKQSKTFLGQWSTLKDNINMTMQAATKPLFELAKSGLNAANKFFTRWNMLRARGIAPFEAAVKSLHTTLNQTLGRGAAGVIIDGINGVANAVRTTIDVVGGLIEAFGTGRGVAAIFRDLPAPIRGVAEALGSMADAVGDVIRGFQFGGIGEVFSRLGEEARQAALAGIDIGKIAIKATFELGKDVVTNVWQWFKEKIGLGANIGDGTDPSLIGREFSFGDVVVTAALKLGDKLKDIWTWFKTEIGWEGALIAAGAGLAFGPIGVAGALLLNGDLKQWAGNLFGWVKQQLGLGGAGGLGGIPIVGAATSSGEEISVGTVLVTAGLKLGGQIAEWIGNLWGWVKGQLGVGGGVGGLGGVPVVGPAVSTANTITLGDVVIDAFLRAGDALSQWAGNVVGFVKQTLGTLSSSAIDLGQVTVEATPKLVSGFWGAAGDAFGWIKSQLGIGGTGGSAFGGVPVVGAATSSGNTISIGSVVLDAVADIGGDLKAIASDVAGWLRGKLNWTGDKTIPVGTITLQGNVVLENTGNQEPGKSFVQKVVDGIKSTANWLHDAGTWVADSFFYGLGAGFGAIAAGIAVLIGGAIGAAVAVIKDPGVIVDAFNWMNDQVKASMERSGNLIKDAFLNFWKGFATAFQGIAVPALPDWLNNFDWLQGPLDKLKEIWKQILDIKNNITGGDKPPFQSPNYRTGAPPPSSEPGMVDGEPVTTLPNVGTGTSAGAPPPIKMPAPDLTAFNAAWATVPLTIGSNMSSALGAASTYSSAINSVVSSQMSSMVSAGSSQMSSFVGAVSSGFATMQSVAAGATSAMVGTVIGILSALPGEGFGIGASLGNGIAAGISATVSAVAASAANVVTAAVQAAKAAGAIASPSRKMMEIGGYMGEGLAIGMDRMQGRVENSMRSLMTSPSPSYAYAARSSGGGRSQARGGDTYIIQGDMLGHRDWEKRVQELAANGTVKIVDQRLATSRQAGR